MSEFSAVVTVFIAILQAKQNADELVASKKELDAQVEAKRKETKEFELKMRQKASTVGNIVGKSVPVSQTEVSNGLSCGNFFLNQTIG